MSWRDSDPVPAKAGSFEYSSGTPSSHSSRSSEIEAVDWSDDVALSGDDIDAREPTPPPVRAPIEQDFRQGFKRRKGKRRRNRNSAPTTPPAELLTAEGPVQIEATPLACEDDDPASQSAELADERRPATRLIPPSSITVSSPQKMLEGASAFVTYLVASERPGEPVERVRRRFSEFVKLYNQLASEYTGCAVPPLPDYSRLEYIAGDRFGAEFTSKRAASLQRFLFRISRHPELGCSRTLAAFLAPRDLIGGSRANNLLQSLNGASPDAGVMEALSDTLLNAFAKVKYQSKEMVEARERADRFEHNVDTLDKSFLRMSRRQADLILDLNDMHRQAVKLAKLEPSISFEFDVLAKTSKAIAGCMADLHGNMDTTFAVALRDMTHYVQAIKALLKQREQRQIDYEALIEYLQRTEVEHTAAQNGSAATSTSSFLRTKVNDLRGVDKEQARQARVAKLAERMRILRDEVAKAKQVSTSFEEVVKREVAVFEATEAIELKASLSSIADGHIAFYTDFLSRCRTIAQEFERGESSGTGRDADTPN